MTTDLEFTAPDPADPGPAAEAAPVPVRNEVAIAGLLAETAEERELAGGALAVRWTLRVSRGERGGGSDLIDCVALDPELARARRWLGRRRVAGGLGRDQAPVLSHRRAHRHPRRGGGLPRREGDAESAADEEVSQPEA